MTRADLTGPISIANGSASSTSQHGINVHSSIWKKAFHIRLGFHSPSCMIYRQSRKGYLLRIRFQSPLIFNQSKSLDSSDDRSNTEYHGSDAG